MRRMLLPLAAAAALCATSCRPRADAVRIGVKSFTEQTILAEAMAAVLRQAGHTVAAPVRCHDTRRCHEAMRSGRVDVLVDYTGTGLAYASGPPGPATLERVRELYAPLGMRWRVPLGFDNGYRVLMPAAEAARHASIGDLSGRPTLRFAVPAEYLRRPRDGLAALLERYGLRATQPPLVIDDPAERYEAVRAGRAEVAVGYATDGLVDESRLAPLADPSGFFPPYAAVIVLSDDALTRHPGLGPALDRLEGRIDTEAMRRLDARVQVEGRDPRAVALDFLIDAGLLDTDAAPPEGGLELVLAHPRDRFAEHVPRARRALRAAFPQRPVRAEALRTPGERLATGGARVAILGAEQLFRWSVRRRRWVPDDRFEALAVLGSAQLHLVRRADDGGGPLDGRLGIEGGAGAARAMLDAAGAGRPKTDDRAALLAAVKAGALDGALLVAAAPDAGLADALGEDLALRPLHGWLTPERAAHMPFLRAARIPAGSYPGQPQPVETVGMQVVLTGAAPGDASTRGGGPAAALPAGAPLDLARVDALVDALGVTEGLDPSLPDAWHRAGPPPEPEGWRAAVEVLLNGFIALFTAWLAWLLLAAPVREQRGAESVTAREPG